jgi:4-amino-4-deoxy-L-arabinose transferase-like glycosyltransferase
MQVPAHSRSFWLGPWPVMTIILALAAIRLLLAGWAELALDEGYYTLWSLHPDWGYLDHPPAVAWFIGLGRLLAGDNEIGVRLLALLSTLLISAAIWRIGALLAGPVVGALAALWYNLNLAIGLSFIITPDTPSVLFWVLAVWAVAEFMASKRAEWWLLVGVFAGLGILGKYTNLFLGLGLVLLIVSAKERWTWLRLPQLWIGGALALLVASPNLLWNMSHGWATALFQGRRLVDTVTAGNFGELVGAQALFSGVPLVLFLLLGVNLFVRLPEARRVLAMPLLTSLPAWLYFTIKSATSRVEANWVLPVWPMLTLVAAFAALDLVHRSGWPRAVGRVGMVAQMAFGTLGFAVLAAQILVQPFDAPDLDRTRELRGWRALQEDIARLAERTNAVWIATPNDYGLVGELTAYGLFANTPVPVLPIGGRLRFNYLPLPAIAAPGWPALWVTGVWGEVSMPPEGLFSTTELLGIVERKQEGAVLGRYAVFRADGPGPNFTALASAETY